MTVRIPKTFSRHKIIACAPVRIISFIPVLHRFIHRNAFIWQLNVHYYCHIVVVAMFLEADVD
jgi:hypothetical protein